LALAVVFCVGLGYVVAQEEEETVSPEETTPVPAATESPGVGDAAAIDTQGFMRPFYFLTAVVAAVAAAATILLFMGMGQGRAKGPSEGERRLTRMLGKSETEFQEGREASEFPQQTH